MNRIAGHLADVEELVLGHKYVNFLGVHFFVRATGIKDLYPSLGLPVFNWHSNNDLS